MPPQSRRIDPTAVAEDEIATLTNATTTLPLDKIRRDGGTQIRLQVDTDKVTEYAEMIGAGIITVHGLVFYDGSDYWLGDGFHRCAGLIELKRTHAHVEVRAGTRRDAVLYAATQANNKHGLPLTKEDRRNAALTLLRDADWSAWTDREIARRVGLTHPTVAKLRVQVEAERRNAAAQERAGAETPGKRKVIRGGTVYEMDVENIGNTPTTRQLVATWLDQRSSNPAARRVLAQQLIESNPTGKLLWRGLLQFLPNIDDKEGVLPHLRAELARLEETAIVDGETYQQATIEDANAASAAASHQRPTAAVGPLYQSDGRGAGGEGLPAAPASTETTIEPGETNTPTAPTAGQPKPSTTTYTGPKQPMTQRSNPVTDLAASYEKHVRAWVDDQCSAGNYTEPRDAAQAALKPDSEPYRSVQAYMSEKVGQWKEGALIIAISDVGMQLSKERNDRILAAAELGKTPVTTATNDDADADVAPATNDDTNPAASHQQTPLYQSDGRGVGGEGLAAAAIEAFTTVSAFAGHVAVNQEQEIATEAWNTPEAALAAAQRGEAKPKHYKALQALQAEKEEEPEEETNWQINQRRQDAANLRRAAELALGHIDSHGCKVAGQSLGQPFARLHTDIVEKLRSLQTLLNDQYPGDASAT